MGRLVKHWAKNQGICNQECLSSYSWVLLTLHFLVQNSYIPSL